MTQIVEARSLGLLTKLAADPPLYPHNPTHASHGPIVLYIVRVPGSKDVFLTPLKPREKVVSAEDVQSSLYYLHVDEPEDTALVPVQDSQSFLSPQVQYPGGYDSAYIARKPLPTPPLSPIDDGMATFSQRHPPFGADVPRRKPVQRNVSNNGELDLPPIPPRPSHRPMKSFDSSFGLQARANPRALPASPGRSPDPEGQNQDEPRYNRRSPFEDRSRQVDAPISLTLIRRDPTSGAQWNVAKIYDPPVEEVSSASLADSGVIRAKRAGAPLFVDICNPGYSKFIHFDSMRPVSRNSNESSSVGSDGQTDGVFRRRIWMDGSRFADHSYTQKRLSSADGHRISRRSLQLSASDFHVSSRAVVDRRSRGYSFRSPWGGKCEFATGVAGRSLKCKHYPEGSGGPHAEVSELRFNLPAAGSSSSASGGSAERVSKRASFTPHLRTHRHTASESQWDDDMTDELSNYFDENGNVNLTLGQERAGGGFHGKRAKLGKLIVDETGLKMLDLTVAANMALWWRAYERT